MKKINLFILSSLFCLSTNVMAQKAKRSTPREKPMVDVDLGVSVGNYNGSSYSEVNLGVNLNITDGLVWRNSGFKRFGSNGTKDITGLDSTMRLVSNNPFDGGAFRLFAGAGYRFTDVSDKNALIGEGGLGLQMGGFGLGGGVKYLKYDKKQYDSNGAETKGEDFIYFFSLAGGTGFSF